MITRARNGQCLTDIALMICGSVEGVWGLALRNGMSVTEEMAAGQAVAYEPEDIIDARVAGRYGMEGIAPAGAITDEAIAMLIEAPKKKAETSIYDLVNADPVKAQSTRASIHEGAFTATFE